MPRKITPPDKPTAVAEGVLWLPSGRYQARLRMGERMWTDSYPTKDDAVAARAAKVLERNGGARIGEASRWTVGDLLARWFDHKSPSLSDASVITYERHIRHLGPLHAERAVRLDVIDVETWMATFMGAGNSARTTGQIAGSLSQAFDMACRLYGRDFRMNPVRLAEKPTIPPPADRMAPKPADVQAVIDAFPERFRIAPYLALELGLRRGEIAGLTVEHIDYDAGTVYVAHQWRRPRGEPAGFHPPKHNSYRTIPVGESRILTRIREHLILQGGPGVLGTVLCGVRDRRPLFDTALDELWNAAAGMAGSELDGYHKLRKAFASWHLDAGENPATVAMWLGDRSMTTFWRNYAKPDSAAAPKTDLAARGEAARRDEIGTSARGARVADGPETPSEVVDLASWRRRR